MLCYHMSETKLMVFKVKDHYYKKAKENNYLARSIYKLEEIDQRYRILKSGDLVFDLGYYPGSWIQYTAKKIGKKGLTIGIDIQDINNKLSSLENVRLFKRDIFDLTSPADLEIGRPADVVLSDMAPNTTGIRSVDQARSLNIVEQVFAILPLLLRPGGNFVIKIFESADAQNFIKGQRKSFEKLTALRPKSTRSISKEFFLIGLNYVSK